MINERTFQEALIKDKFKEERDSLKKSSYTNLAYTSTEYNRALLNKY